ncbi:MAG: CDP-alcohol phosphatidyltransferase family protein [Paludibacteraceae bacterium]|nr:CDP-alcohol phosphatidyltransferase family protein [Paludibacteraceae bacterium]
MEEKKQAQRIQTSILNAAEKKTLVWIAERLPRWVTSDMMTVVGLIGAVIICVGYVLSNINLNFLWLASFGLVVNWFGDSLDGTVARVRNQQRPRYGYFLDHNIDSLNEALMFVGAGLSSMMHLGLALGIYGVYMALTVYVSINAHLKSEFKLTYGKLGPTEFRVIVMLINTIYLYVKPLHTWHFDISYFGQPVSFSAFDMGGFVILCILLIMWAVSFIKDARYFAELEPLPRKKENDKKDNAKKA